MILKKVIYMEDDYPEGSGWYYQLDDAEIPKGPYATASEAKIAMWEEARQLKIELWPD